MTPNNTPAPKPTPLAIRLWPLYVIGAGLLASWAFGLFDYFSLETLRTQQDALRGFVSEHLVLAVGAYVLIYAAATLFMIPGALWITIAGGFLFGLYGGTPATVAGATLGASLLFFAARTSVGAALRERAGPFVKKMERGFQEDALSYMFALRFLPIVPFPVANIAPAVLGAKYRDYAITTALGIIPGVIAYTWIGAGLGATFAAGEDPNIANIARNLVPAFAALGVVSLIPVAYKKLFSKKAAKLESAS
ncbi:TVP38/TMEM64 family protein [Hyphomonas sp.]|uniref:TVP38/TMEM64 family protein n=1 Tax=Hyphomonas sp. TaxID=87 RepID=UPI003D27A534|tara:strand:- start:342 stop:1091 length:750 start_codon:yes stop_codon:yes gene_type:complete